MFYLPINRTAPAGMKKQKQGSNLGAGLKVFAQNRKAMQSRSEDRLYPRYRLIFNNRSQAPVSNKVTLKGKPSSRHPSSRACKTSKTAFSLVHQNASKNAYITKTLVFISELKS